jgi:hypothetical protein
MQLLKKLFTRRLKTRLSSDKYKIVEAFSIGGTTYYMFDNQFEVPTGRQMAAIAVYEEMNMRCTREYLDMHTRAMDKILGMKRLTITECTYIAQLNNNLKERLELMPLPDFIYKLASVVFFDRSESEFSYDYAYNEKKIKKWKAAGGTLDFFSTRLAKDLIPSLTMPEASSKMYFQVASQIDKIHHKHLTDILSAKA